MSISIRPFRQSDWNSVSGIYHQGLLSRNATFETTVPDYETWSKKFPSSLLWVAVADGLVVGWAALQPVSARKVYEGVVEVTIYVATEHSGLEKNS